MISLGIDIGGTGCKCVAFREDGTQLALSYKEYPNPSGKKNLDAEILKDSVFYVTENCVKEVKTQVSLEEVVLQPGSVNLIELM